MIPLDFTDMKIKRLTGDDKIDAFCSGDAEIDDYVINQAHLYSQQLLSSNYVLLSGKHNNLPIAFLRYLAIECVCLIL